jgi:hypothetical protein
METRDFSQPLPELEINEKRHVLKLSPGDRNMINKLFIWLLLMLCSCRLWATGQEGDRLVIGKDTFQLLATPLQKILLERNITPKDLWRDNPDFNTACWRTYIATWKL